MPTAPTRLTQATGALTTAATRLMEEGLPWYRELGAQERSWVADVAQAGITAFLDWYEHPARRGALSDHVFGAAPRELARAISLEQTVALVRTTVAVMESAIDELVEPADHLAMREAILTYSREIAFAAAEVYARAAEARGAWDARLEAFIVDALLRDDMDAAALGRAAALGWTERNDIAVIAGTASEGSGEATLDALRRAASHHELDLIAGLIGTTLLAVVAGADAARAARLLAPHFGPGPVVFSQTVGAFANVPAAARATTAALRAVAAWPQAPRPVNAGELLPERAIAGDASATADLVASVYRPLAAEPALLQTLSKFLEQTPSLEATARALFIHPNTVRYRLKQVTELTGLSPTQPREAFTLHLALTLGRLSAS